MFSGFLLKAGLEIKENTILYLYLQKKIRDTKRFNSCNLSPLSIQMSEGNKKCYIPGRKIIEAVNRTFYRAMVLWYNTVHVHALTIINLNLSKSLKKCSHTLSVAQRFKKELKNVIVPNMFDGCGHHAL